MTTEQLSRDLDQYDQFQVTYLTRNVRSTSPFVNFSVSNITKSIINVIIGYSTLHDNISIISFSKWWLLLSFDVFECTI